MAIGIYQAFDMIGAELVVETAGDVFEIDIRQQAGREAFRVRYPWADVVAAEALEVKPKLRHLVLDVSGWRLPIGGRFLCGHDERHWFVAALPVNRRTTTVRGAIEALKPEVVLREKKRLGVRHRRYRRKTAAYVRQGEWFFLPRPMMHVGDLAVRNGQLTREGGKPHDVEWIYRPDGSDAIFVRGAVSHPDHETIRLQVWHRVVQNTENQTRSRDQGSTRLAYVD
jgi:hypothetical protein